MPARRKPTRELEATGTLRDHPGRYAARANEPREIDKLGDCPSYMSVKLKRIWREIVGNVPEGWLKRSDRPTLELCVRLMEQLRAGTISNQGMSVLNTTLAKLGFNPSDRSRVSMPPPAARDNAWSAFTDLSDE